MWEEPSQYELAKQNNIGDVRPDQRMEYTAGG